MGANSNKILHVDTVNLSIYDSNDLTFFQEILDDIFREHECIGSLAANDREYLRAQLAAAIFRTASAGERDYMRLKRSAIEAVSPAPSSPSGA